LIAPHSQPVSGSTTVGCLAPVPGTGRFRKPKISRRDYAARA
jgi:hypothetical protein